MSPPRGIVPFHAQPGPRCAVDWACVADSTERAGVGGALTGMRQCFTHDEESD